MTNKICNWSQEDDEYGTWETDCGKAFIINEGIPSENDFKYCCYCGLPLTESPYDENEEE